MTSALREISDTAHLPTRIIGLDHATSLLGTQLTNEVTQKLTEHMDLIANELGCCVLLINHTHRNNNTRSQGAYPLANNIDGDFVLERDFNHTVNGQRLGLRSVLAIERLKPIMDVDYALEFVGTPVTVELDGELLNLVAFRCTGRIAVTQVDIDAVKRLQLAEALAPGKEMALSALAKLTWNNKGGNQIAVIERVVPENEWIGVTITSGEMRELMRYRRGSYQYVQCRAVTPPPQTKEDGEKTKCQYEPESALAKLRQAGATHGKKDAKAQHAIKISTMPADDYRAALSRQLGEDDRPGAFCDAVTKMQQAGAELTEDGSRAMAYIASVAADGSVDGMKRAVKDALQVPKRSQIHGMGFAHGEPQSQAGENGQAPGHQGRRPSAHRGRGTQGYRSGPGR